MDLRWSAAGREFRDDVRTWLQQRANVLVAGAVSRTAYTAMGFDEDGPDAELQAAAARLIASTAAGENSADNIQSHGGIGFTDECDAHLYLQRWRAPERLLGDRFTVADRFADLEAAQ
jgi:alkylation response protein AidB-like acyl-CoA dehydrogenase